jgi:NAD(P)-dependent dehydrogenase (short-subunit alcohol dehydrogenase family)
MTPLIEGLSAPAHVVVTGASSGIGLALVTQLLANSQVAQVHAIARRAELSAALQALRNEHGDRLLCCAMDITDAHSRQLGVARITHRSAQLHCLIHAAGVLHAPDIRPEKSINQLNEPALVQLLQVNAIAPILLTQALLPALRQAPAGVIAAISARVGSISDNALGGWYSYRASKAAQNQLFRTLSIEVRRSHPNLRVVSLHPGTVDTPLAAPFKANVAADRLFTPALSATHLLRVIAGLHNEDSGQFFAWDGQAIPW